MEESYEDMAKKEDQPDHHRDITCLAGNAALAGVSDFTYGILRYITNVVMTHMVTPGVYGVFGEVYTAMLLLGWIAKLGFDGVLILLLPVYRVKDRQDLVNGLARFTVRITLISGLIVGGLTFAFAATIARLFYHNPSYKLPLQEVAFLVPLIALQAILAAGLQAYKEVKWKVSVDRLCQPLISLILLAIFFVWGWRMEALSISTIGGYFCSILIGQIGLNKILKRDSRHTQSSHNIKLWFYTAIPQLFYVLVASILNSTDVLFLSLYALPAQAAVYIAADRISSLVGMPLMALNVIFSPMIAEYHASEKHEQLASMLKLVTKWSLSLSLPVFLASLIFHNAMLGIFGSQYTAGGLALIILCIGNVVNAGTGSIQQLLALTGHMRMFLANSIIAICANVVLSLVLIPHFNILGAALAVALTEVMFNAMGVIEVYWIMKIHPYRWDIYKPLIAGCASCVVAIALVHFIHISAGSFANIEELVLLIPFILVYCLVLVLLGFSKEDQVIFNAMLARFGKGSSNL